jgi:hypothetical protein
MSTIPTGGTRPAAGDAAPEPKEEEVSAAPSTASSQMSQSGHLSGLSKRPRFFDPVRDAQSSSAAPDSGGVAKRSRTDAGGHASAFSSVVHPGSVAPASFSFSSRLQAFGEKKSDIPAADVAEYLELERLHSDLFSSPEIVRTSPDNRLPFKYAKRVEMEAMGVINTARDGFDAIGTGGLGPCVAIGARGINDDGEAVLGVAHFSARQDLSTVMSGLSTQMRTEGVKEPRFYFVGGMVGSKGSGKGTLKLEQRLLAMRGQLTLRGVRLHTSPCEINEDGQRNSVDMVLTTRGIVYGAYRMPMHRS